MTSSQVNYKMDKDSDNVLKDFVAATEGLVLCIDPSLEEQLKHKMRESGLVDQVLEKQAFDNKMKRTLGVKRIKVTPPMP